MAFSNLEKALALMVGLDITRPGTSRSAAKAAVRALARATPPAAAATSRFAMANPYVAGTALGGAVLASPVGDLLLEEAEERGRRSRLATERLIQDYTTPRSQQREQLAKKIVRKASPFNKAIKAGMAAVKKSKSFGKPGTISNAKRAFATVTKTVSGLKKGRKPPKKGIRKAIYRATKRYI
jgi:hypothetical protein